MSETLDAAMAPVRPEDRIDVIDILRGMTLFGILAANMRGFNAPSAVYFNIGQMFAGQADKIGQGIIDFFIQGKCVTLFAFLFGLGFAVQMTRAEERGKSTSFYPRRMAILFVIGMIHSIFIWWGDILVPYALTGLLLLLFRKSSQKTVAWWSVSLFLAEFVIDGIIQMWRHFHPAIPPTPAPPAVTGMTTELWHAVSVNRDGSYLGMLRFRAPEWFHVNWPPFWWITFVLPRFLAGLWVWRSGVLQNLPDRLPLVKKICAWSLVLGLIGNAGMFYFNVVVQRPRGWSLPRFFSQLSHSVSLAALACFYACAVLILVQNPVWKRRLAPFGAVGRTALTNYLLQSLICTWFFHWTKLYGKVGPAMGIIPTVVLFAVQIPISVWWLQHYQFGPAEWLWRSLTYGKFQSLRRPIPPPLQVAEA